MEIGEKLKECRKNCKMSQEEVAQKINTTRQAISRWERDESLPDIHMLQKLTEIYGVKLSDFVETEGNKKALEEKSKEKDVSSNVNDKQDLIIVLLYGIFLVMSATIPVLGLLVPIYVFLKYKNENKKYVIILRIIAAFCLVVAVYNIYLIVYLKFIDNGITEITPL